MPRGRGKIGVMRRNERRWGGMKAVGLAGMRRGEDG